MAQAESHFHPMYGHAIPERVERYEVVEELKHEKNRNLVVALLGIVALLAVAFGVTYVVYSDVPAPPHPANANPSMPDPPSYY